MKWTQGARQEAEQHFHCGNEIVILQADVNPSTMQYITCILWVSVNSVQGMFLTAALNFHNVCEWNVCMIMLIIRAVQSVVPHVTEKLKLKVLQIEFCFLSVLHSI